MPHAGFGLLKRWGDADASLRSGRIDGQVLSPLEARRAVLAEAALSSNRQSSMHSRTCSRPHHSSRDIVSPEGVLLPSAGQRLNDDLIGRIRAFERTGADASCPVAIGGFPMKRRLSG